MRALCALPPGSALTPRILSRTSACTPRTAPDLKLHLASTDYGNFLANEPSPLATTTIAEVGRRPGPGPGRARPAASLTVPSPGALSPSDRAQKCTQKLVDEFNYLRAHSVEPLSTFLDYITYAASVGARPVRPSATKNRVLPVVGPPRIHVPPRRYSYMIDNVVLLITGTLHERDTTELLEKCHPLGMFEAMATLCVATNTQELFNSVLIDTPLAPYFAQCLSEEDLDEMNIEIIRNTLYKAYLEDFNKYCQKLGGDTADFMAVILQVRARGAAAPGGDGRRARGGD